MTGTRDGGWMLLPALGFVLAAGLISTTTGSRTVDGIAVARVASQRFGTDLLVRNGLAATLQLLSASATPATETTMALPGGTLTLRLTDATGLVSVNSGSTELLERLFAAKGDSPALAHDRAGRIVAHATDQRTSGGYVTLDEAAGFFADAPDLWTRVAPAMTALGAHMGLDPDSAPRDALLAIPGMTADAADALLKARTGPGWENARRAAEQDYRPFLGETRSGLFEARLDLLGAGSGNDRLQLVRISASLVRDAAGRARILRVGWPEARI